MTPLDPPSLHPGEPCGEWVLAGVKTADHGGCRATLPKQCPVRNSGAPSGQRRNLRIASDRCRSQSSRPRCRPISRGKVDAPSRPSGNGGPAVPGAHDRQPACRSHWPEPALAALRGGSVEPGLALRSHAYPDRQRPAFPRGHHRPGDPGDGRLDDAPDAPRGEGIASDALVMAIERQRPALMARLPSRRRAADPHR